MPLAQWELQAFEEVLDIARKDLRTLLTRDHLPPGGAALIERERKVVADLEWLVYDATTKIAMHELAKLRLG